MMRAVKPSNERVDELLEVGGLTNCAGHRECIQGMNGVVNMLFVRRVVKGYLDFVYSELVQAVQ